MANWLQYQQLASLFRAGIDSGEVQPLPATIFSKHQAQAALSGLTKGW